MEDEKTIAQKAYDMMAEIERDEHGCPKTLDGCIRHVILKSPDMFQYRDDALNLIYCVLGTGLSWQNGRIRDIEPNNFLNLPPQAGGQGIWSMRFGFRDSIDGMDVGKTVVKNIIDQQMNKMEKAINTVLEVDKRVQAYSSGRDKFYPMSWFSCNLCAPSDAKQDFYEGALETVHLILNSEPEYGTRKWIDFQRTKTHAEEILIALKGMEQYNKV